MNSIQEFFPVEEFKDITNSSRTSSTHHNSESELLMMDRSIYCVYPDWSISWKTILTGVTVLIMLLAVVWYNPDCYQLGFCHSKSLPSVSHFVGREEDIRNITGYLDFYTSDVQVVHIVGPPGFGKSTLAMKIGEILLTRKRVKVYYVDLRTVKDIDSMSDMVMRSIVDSLKYKITFSRLEKWVRDQYSETLIILDNCDELFEYVNEEFCRAIKSLTIASSRNNVRYILTSQKHVTDIGNFRLHAIYNLSSEASIQLLGEVAPSLTDDQKRQIADLTGNVPLAIEVVGAIFKFPDAPTAEEVVQGLRENLVSTLSPDELHSKVDVSMGVAYSYLSPELKQLCVNLSHFPDKFSKESAVAIFNFRGQMLDKLVQRSLLQYERSQKQFHYHQLLKMFFTQVSVGKDAEKLQYYFNSRYQYHFAQLLQKAIPDNVKKLEMEILYNEVHNILHMFTLFISHKHANYTFFAIKTVSHEFRINILLRFLPPLTPLLLLKCLDSYSEDERASVESFFETYIRVVILAVKSKPKVRHAIKLLSTKRKEVDKRYKNGTLSPHMYTQFYTILGNYYNEIGDVEKSNRCYSKILRKTHNELDHCYPICDYFSLSVAYQNIGDIEMAFNFRKVAYHQIPLLYRMDEIRLLLHLYNDYMNTSLGYDFTEAEAFAVEITQRAYQYLLNADRSEYSEDIYYMAIEFFRSQNLEVIVVELQEKMVASGIPCDCDETLKGGEYLKKTRELFLFPTDDPNVSPEILCNHKCAINRGDSAIGSFRKQYYHLAIWYGEQSYASADNLGESYAEYKCVPSLFVGKSYYELGNYSAANVWLHGALQCLNKAIRHNFLSFPLRDARCESCIRLFLTGEVSNIFCYVHIVCDIVICCIVLLLFLLVCPCLVWKEYFGPQEITLSTTTSLMEQKHSFVWTQINVISNSVDISQQWTNTLLLVLFIIAVCCYYYLTMCCCLYVCRTKIVVRKSVTIFIVIFLAIDELLYYFSY